MQSKLYTVSFSYCLMTDCVASPWAAIAEPVDFPELMYIADFDNSQKKGWTHRRWGQVKRELLLPSHAPFINWA